MSLGAVDVIDIATAHPARSPGGAGEGTSEALSPRAVSEKDVLAEVEALVPMSEQLPETLRWPRQLRLKKLVRSHLIVERQKDEPNARWFERLVREARFVDAEIAWEEVLERVRTKRTATVQPLIELVVLCPEQHWRDFVVSSLRFAFAELLACEDVFRVEQVRRRVERRVADYVGPLGTMLLRTLIWEQGGDTADSPPEHPGDVVRLIPRTYASVAELVAVVPNATAAVKAVALLVVMLERYRSALAPSPHRAASRAPYGRQGPWPGRRRER